MMFLLGNQKSSSSASSSTSHATKHKKKGDAEEIAKSWKRKLKSEMRKIERDIGKIKSAEQKSVAECKKLAKQGRTSAVKILAKEIVNARKSTERLYMAKAQLNSVSNSLQTSLSMMKMQGCLSKSAEIMGLMNKLVNIKEIKETMTSMAREMERSGLVDEIIGDTLESMEPEDMNAEVDKEVDKILTELTEGTLAPASAAPTRQFNKAPEVEQNVEEEVNEEDSKFADDLMSRLQAL